MSAMLVRYFLQQFKDRKLSNHESFDPNKSNLSDSDLTDDNSLKASIYESIKKGDKETNVWKQALGDLQNSVQDAKQTFFNEIKNTSELESIAINEREDEIYRKIQEFINNGNRNAIKRIITTLHKAELAFHHLEKYETDTALRRLREDEERKIYENYLKKIKWERFWENVKRSCLWGCLVVLLYSGAFALSFITCGAIKIPIHHTFSSSDEKAKPEALYCKSFKGVFITSENN